MDEFCVTSVDDERVANHEDDDNTGADHNNGHDIYGRISMIYR